MTPNDESGMKPPPKLLIHQTIYTDTGITKKNQNSHIA